MKQLGILVDYQWCTGCHSCEIACRNEKGIGLGEWGMKLMEVGPWQVGDTDQFEWNYIPVPTNYCDYCVDRLEEGRRPACAHNCLADVIQVGSVEELTKEMIGHDRRVMFTPKAC